MAGNRRRPMPKDVDALRAHLSKHGLHLHKTISPARWVLISGDEGYIPCQEGECLNERS